MSDCVPSDPSKTCPKCGAELSAGDTNGLCPACLMAEVMQPTQSDDEAKLRRSAILTPEELAPLLPQYEIMHILGRGGMGAVYLARQISLNRLVAIKILPSDFDEGELNFAERFKNEAHAMAQLSHPGIVAVYDFGQTAVGRFVPEAPSGERRAGDSPPHQGLLYIVMEYIEGTDVALMVAQQGRLHSAHAMAITAHVCDALAYAHSRGIIHRDIKPSNIMVSNDGVVKVADFGLAKMSHGGQTAGITLSGMTMGTLHFMAPEVLTLGVAVDQRADIYAVGVMLYQMLTGKLPQGLFEMPSLQVPGLDPRYDGIVTKALREDRNVRYQQASELRHDLDAILTQPVVKVEPEAEKAPVAVSRAQQSPPHRPPSQPYRPAQRSAPMPVKKKFSSGLILAGLGTLAVIAAGLFWMGGRGGTTSQPAQATKHQPFVNTLDMKFVPVAITGESTTGKKLVLSAGKEQKRSLAPQLFIAKTFGDCEAHLGQPTWVLAPTESMRVHALVYHAPKPGVEKLCIESPQSFASTTPASRVVTSVSYDFQARSVHTVRGIFDEANLNMQGVYTTTGDDLSGESEGTDITGEEALSESTVTFFHGLAGGLRAFWTPASVSMRSTESFRHEGIDRLTVQQQRGPTPRERLANIKKGYDPEGTVVLGRSADLAARGAFGFPQQDAKVLSDQHIARFSAWSNPEWLYLQIICWADADPENSTTPDGKKRCDESHVYIDLDNDLEREPEDAHYALNPEPAMRGLHREKTLNDSGGKFVPDSAGRGSIRFVDGDTSSKIRVDSFLIPLREIGKKPGDRIRLAVIGISWKPRIGFNSAQLGLPNSPQSFYRELAGRYYQDFVLGMNRGNLEPAMVPHDSSE